MTAPGAAWTELEFEGEAGSPPPEPAPGAPLPKEPDDEPPGAHSDPYWVGAAGRYQLGLPADLADQADVHLLYETERQVAVVETAPAGADPRGPSVLSRTS